MNTYVIEQMVEEKISEVVGVRLTLEAAQALCDEILDKVQIFGPREWETEWREGTDTTQHDPDTKLRDWSAHRPDKFRKPYETWLFLTITEHPVPEETP